LSPVGPPAPQAARPAAPAPAPAPAPSPSTATMVAPGLPGSGRAAPTAPGEVEPPLRLLGPAPAGRRLEGSTGPVGLREPLGGYVEPLAVLVNQLVAPEPPDRVSDP
jgi:hypothetical protein